MKIDRAKLNKRFHPAEELITKYVGSVGTP
jgi:hypothetical protein